MNDIFLAPYFACPPAVRQLTCNMLHTAIAVGINYNFFEIRV